MSCILSLCTFLLFAQAKPATKRVDLTLKSEVEDLLVFNDWVRWNDPGSLLITHLNGQAAQYYQSRDQEIKNLKTKNDWISRQKQIKDQLQQLIGPFPEKGALNPKITGIVQKDGYRIEKIIYESRPHFYVSGCLFIPDHATGKIPGILNLIGHEQESFRAELDQLVMINLVKKGMMVMTIDPPGQGENVQYFDPKIGVSSIGYSVIEHCYFGNQCFLTGTSSASYFIWDAIWSLDYLVG
ncbi:MAG: hypothetical protein IPL46_19410 [Saprospiraceae bacterium]|nr:hypothetical protein [Saprospiraceae bacterium]